MVFNGKRLDIILLRMGKHKDAYSLYLYLTRSPSQDNTAKEKKKEEDIQVGKKKQDCLYLYTMLSPM